jgi:hypothetical protein
MAHQLWSRMIEEEETLSPGSSPDLHLIFVLMITAMIQVPDELVTQPTIPRTARHRPPCTILF